MYTFDSREQLLEWISKNVISTAEATEIMGCTRQNLHGFVKNGKLAPIKETAKERLFLLSDVLERKEQASKYNRNARTTE